MPSRRTRCAANCRPGVNGRRRGPATVETMIPNRIATVTSATIDGRKPVTRRAAIGDRDGGGETGDDRCDPSSERGRVGGRGRQDGASPGLCDTVVRRPAAGFPGAGVVRLEGERPVAQPAHAVEFEPVLRVRLVRQRGRLGVRRATGRGARLGAAVPQAERHAQAVGLGRALEVVGEARRLHRLVVRPVVVGREAVLVDARLAPRAERDHVPLTGLDLVAAGVPGEGVSHGKAGVPVGDREQAIEAGARSMAHVGAA